MMALKFTFALLSIVLFGTSVSPGLATENNASYAPYRIGVLAYKGKEAAVERWSAHGTYLNRRLIPLGFEIVPLTYTQDELTRAVINRQVDFVITNPGHYTELELGGHVSRLATRRMSGPEGVLDQFGGTVITRPDRADLNTYVDLAGKKILIPSQSSLGGWQVHLREAMAQGVDLRRDAQIIELKNHRKVVEAIVAGQADAGFVRSDLIEELVAQESFRFEQIKVVNKREEPKYPYLLSTRLYPEWPFAQVSGTSPEIAVKVLQMLLAISPDDDAAKAAGIHGWTIPGHYSTVGDLFRETGLGPFSAQPLTFKTILKQYWQEIVVLATLFVFLLLLNTLRTTRANRALRHEIQERKRAEEQIRTLSQAIEQSPVSVMITDPEANIEYVNSTFERITGYSLAEVMGHKPPILASSSKHQDQHSELWQVISKGKAWRGEFQSRKKSGELFWEHAHIAPVLDDSGIIRHYLAVKEDVTLRKQQEEHILQQAHFDSLTTLPNRFLALDRLSLFLKEAHRNNELIAVLFLDLDDFKKINDTLGHESGDKLLIEAASRLCNAVRSSDTVGRLGGDEFIILLGGLSDAADARPVVENLLNEFREAFKIDGRELFITASVGIAVYPSDGAYAAELLRNADSAMYHAKDQGRNTYSYFTDAMNQEVSRRLALDEQMHGALDRGEFWLCYQPQVNLGNSSMIGVETLLRWRNPALGEVSSGEFIPIAEQTGLIVPIGQFVLTKALGMVAKWQQKYEQQFKIAVNLSPRQFRDPNLVTFIKEAIYQSGVSSKSLELEITEGVLMSGRAYIHDTLAMLSDLGVSIAMDDFGTGYSSLSYLRNYPFDVLKIDRDFINDITVDPADCELVNAVIAMAHGLGLKVVAEGVETEEQLVLLSAQGCEFAQGYHFSKPVSAEEITGMLETLHGDLTNFAESTESLSTAAPLGEEDSPRRG